MGGAKGATMDSWHRCIIREMHGCKNGQIRMDIVTLDLGMRITKHRYDRCHTYFDEKYMGVTGITYRDTCN